MNELKKIMKDNNLNQSDLAELLNISRMAVNNWVTGKKPVPKKRKEEISHIINSGKAKQYLVEKHGEFNING